MTVHFIINKLTKAFLSISFRKILIRDIIQAITLSIALYLSGRPQVAIVRALHHLNVNKSFVSRTIACYRDTDSIASRPKSERKKRNLRSGLSDRYVLVLECINIEIAVV